MYKLNPNITFIRKITILSFLKVILSFHLLKITKKSLSFSSSSSSTTSLPNNLFSTFTRNRRFSSEKEVTPSLLKKFGNLIQLPIISGSWHWIYSRVRQKGSWRRNLARRSRKNSGFVKGKRKEKRKRREGSSTRSDRSIERIPSGNVFHRDEESAERLLPFN